MVLTEEIIVQFPARTPAKTISRTEAAFGLKRVQSFALRKNTFLYELGDPFHGLAVSNDLQRSGS
jgi:hypothetical protein